MDVQTLQRPSIYTLVLQNGEVVQKTLHAPYRTRKGCLAISVKDRNNYMLRIRRPKPDSIHASVAVPDYTHWEHRYLVEFGIVGCTGEGHTAIYEELWSMQEMRWKPLRILSALATVRYGFNGRTHSEKPDDLASALEAVRDLLNRRIRNSSRPKWFSDGMCRVRDARIEKASSLAKEMTSRTRVGSGSIIDRSE